MSTKPFRLSTFLLLISFSQLLLAQSFQETKKLARQIWAEHRLTYYCECPFDSHLNVQLNHCHYQPGKGKRAKRVEWEHIVPVSWFGHQRSCWREDVCIKKNGKPFKGRQCCEMKDEAFRQMMNDLHNVIPVIGEINQARKAYRFAELVPDKIENGYHGCELIIDSDRRLIVPPKSDRGLIARANLYMIDSYGLKLSKRQLELFKRWNQQYPPSAWERRWNDKIKEVQGTDNQFISGYAILME